MDAGLDLRTPQAAVQAYGEGLRDSDERKLRALMHPTGRRADAFVDLFVSWVKSSARLERAALHKYGKDEAERLVGALFLPAAGPTGRGLLENLADAEVNVEGEQAVVLIDPVGQVDLRRIDGRWRMVVPELPPKGKPEEGTGGRWQIELMKVATRAQQEVSAGIEAGRYATAADAAEALEQIAQTAMDRP